MDVFERAAALRPVGAGLLIQPTGMHVLDRLGVLERAFSLGHRINQLAGDTDGGRAVLALSYEDFMPGAFGLGMHRGALFSLLLESAMREATVRVHAGVDVAGLHQSPAHVTLRTRGGAMLGPYDLVAIADGAKSKLRESLDVGARTTQYPYAAAWCVLPMPAHERWHHTLRQVYRDTRGMVGYLPVGKASADGEPMLSLFWSLRASDIAATRAAGIAAFERALVALDGHAAPLMRHVESMEQLVFATYHDTVCERTHHHRVVLLGDAAHAMSPQLGQGANLALVDALTLAEMIGASGGERDLVPMALERHDERRREHVAFYARASRWLTPWFQSDFAGLSVIRDVMMHPMSRVGWVRRQMGESLAGVKTGVFSSYKRLEPADSRVAIS